METTQPSGSDNDNRSPLADRWNEAVEYDRTRNKIGQIIQSEAKKERKLHQLTWYAVAASVVVAFGLFGILKPFGSGPDQDSSSLAMKDSTANDRSKSAQSIHFNVEQPKSYATKASVNSDSLSKIMISPRDSASFTLSDTIHLKWKALAYHSVLTVSRYPEGKTVYSTNISAGDSTFLLEAGKLKPGWFVWSLTAEGEHRLFQIHQ